MEFTTHEAKTHFSKLIARMQSGEEIIITTGRDKTPIARLVPAERQGGIRLGLYESVCGPVSSVDDVLAPVYTEEELQSFANNPL